MRRCSDVRLLAVLLSALALGACGGGGDSGGSGGGGGGGGTTTYTVGGTVSGLAGSVVLQLNGGNNLTVNASGAFTFTTGITAGTAYSVTVLTQPTGQICTPGSATGTMGSANIANVTIACTGNIYTVGGTASGLSGSASLALYTGGGTTPTATLTVSSSGTFTFSGAPLATGTTYVVVFGGLPTGQTCTLASNFGTIASASVTNVSLACANFSITGSVTGLTGSGLVLQLNQSNDLSVAAASSNFNYGSSASLGLAPFYVVHIKTQPTGQTCTILNSTGVVTATAATISGVSAPAVACINNTTAALSGTYQLDTSAINTSSGRYFITFNADGTWIAGIRNDDSTCAANNGNGVNYGVYNWNQTTQVLTIVNRVLDTTGDCGFEPGSTGTATRNSDGTLSWITTDGYGPHETLRFIPVASTASSLVGSWGDNQGFAVFSAPTAGSGKLISVTTKSIVQNGAAFPGIEDGCYTMTGTTAAGTFTTNFSSTCTVIDDVKGVDTSGPVGYSGVTVPVTFAVSGDSVTAPAGPVPPIYGPTSRIIPTTFPSAVYSVSATISGLSASGLVLRSNGTGNIAVASGATTQTIATGVATGAPYIVAVVAQPAGLTCSVANPSGIVGSANVTNIAIACSAVSAFTVGGTVSGSTPTGLILRNNGGDELTVNATGGYTFATSVATGNPYSVSVWQQPTGQYCVTNVTANGIMASSPVTNVAVTCAALGSTYSVGGSISNLHASGLVLSVLNNSDIAVSSGATTFTAISALPVNTLYGVSIKTQPTGQTCTIVNAAGVIPNTAPANVSNIQVACVDNTFNPLTGTYRIAVDGLATPVVVTFFSDGTYILASLEKDDPTCNGVEYGVYRWNSTTNAFAFVNAVVDTNNDCGVNDSGALLSGTLTKSGTTLTADLLNNDGSGAHIAVVLKPVRSVDGTLIGAWTGPAQLGFTVYFSEDGDNAVLNVYASQVTTNIAIAPGLEHACYTITNASAGNVTYDFSAGCSPRDMPVVDTLSNGLSAFGSNPVPFVVSGDFLSGGQHRVVAQ